MTILLEILLLCLVTTSFMRRGGALLVPRLAVRS